MDKARAQSVKMLLTLQAIEDVLEENKLVQPGQIREMAKAKLEASSIDEEEKQKIREEFNPQVIAEK